MNIINILKESDQNELHIARLIILISYFKDKQNQCKINGLTKLAKLDFLLRYPTYLEHALVAINKLKDNVNIQEYEQNNVESRMVRYHYGPWDHKYRRLINEMVSKSIAWVEIDNRTTYIGLTSFGLKLADEFINNEDFIDVAQRSEILKKYFDIRGTQLKDFIYDTFPSISSLRMGDEI